MYVLSYGFGRKYKQVKKHLTKKMARIWIKHISDAWTCLSDGTQATRVLIKSIAVD